MICAVAFGQSKLDHWCQTGKLAEQTIYKFPAFNPALSLYHQTASSSLRSNQGTNMEDLMEDKGLPSNFLLHVSHNIKDGDFQRGMGAMLNHILRTFYVYANRQHLKDDAVGAK